MSTHTLLQIARVCGTQYTSRHPVHVRSHADHRSCCCRLFSLSCLISCFLCKCLNVKWPHVTLSDCMQMESHFGHWCFIGLGQYYHTRGRREVWICRCRPQLSCAGITVMAMYLTLPTLRLQSHQKLTATQQVRLLPEGS